MTSLENFLNKTKDNPIVPMEPASGSFMCQHEDCDEIINDGYIDRHNNKLHWTCVHGHESSVVV
jgi:hypothetical protein